MNCFSCFSCFTCIDNENKECSTITNDRVIMKGCITKGMLNGKGVMVYPSGTIESGTFKNSELEGEGEINLPTGMKLKGSFHEGNPIDVDVINKSGNTYHVKFTDHGIDILK